MLITAPFRVRFAPFVKGWTRWALQGWFGLIAVSVLTTYQHHVVDVPAGVLVGVVCIGVTRAWGADRVGVVLASLRAGKPGSPVRVTGR